MADGQQSVTANSIITFDDGSNALMSYKPSADAWQKIGDFHKHMTGTDSFSAVATDKHIYVLMENRYVYQLSIPDMIWKQISGMRADHGPRPSAVSLDGLIYVAGGSLSLIGQPSGSFESLDPSMNQWTKLNSLKEGRCDPALVALKGKLYCVGGRGEEEESLSSVERYDPANNQWKDVASMQQSKAYPTAAVQDDVIYVTDSQKSDAIEYYNSTSNTWTLVNMTGSFFADVWFLKFVSVDQKIFCVQRHKTDCVITSFDTKGNEWKLVTRKKDLEINTVASVALRL